ncbi:MAG: preprotein translocase subunit SecE [Planctomycetota bacterium]|jgi:preprotein translocase SecE subunit|nr:preprotein translocase subunit SecE [Planctomycetota bacterium]
MTIYKQGQGHLTRLASVVLAGLIGAYSGFCWYSWRISAQDNLSMHDNSAFFAVSALIGGAVILVAALAAGFWLAYVKPRSGEFLIDVDGEMRKVVWPDVLPLFDPKTSAWGSTYVVIITSIILTVYIAIIDIIFEWGLTEHLLRWLLVA